MERERQEKLHPYKRPSKNDNEEVIALKEYIFANEMLSILVEEVGEVAKAIQEGTNLSEELIQTASVCIRWLEAIKEKPPL